MCLSSSLANVFGHTGGYLRIEWHTVPVVSAEVRQLFGQILHLLRQESIHRLFTERTTTPPISGEDCRWMALEWLPQAANAAFRHVGPADALLEAAYATVITRSASAVSAFIARVMVRSS